MSGARRTVRATTERPVPPEDGPSRPTEVRITIELLDQHGAVMDSTEVLCDPDEATVGEFEAAYDSMIENNTPDDDDEDEEPACCCLYHATGGPAALCCGGETAMAHIGPKEYAAAVERVRAAGGRLS